MEKVMIDRRMKNKIEELGDWNEAYSVKFIDIDDTFWFDDKSDVQEFLNTVARERYYEKDCRKGYFDYTNDANEILRYYVETNRGTLRVIKEENLGVVA